MKQELTITILLLAAGAGLWLWQSDLNTESMFDSQAQTAQLDAESLGSRRADSLDGDAPDDLSPGHWQTVEFLQKLAARLQTAPALNAQLQVDLNLPGAPIRLNGEYLQSGQGGHQSRTELRLPTENGDITLLKICDGRFLYTQFKTPQKKTLEFVDLQQCTKRRNYDQQTEPGNPMRWIADGGFAGAFKHLSEAFHFQPMEIKQDGESRVFVVRGSWNQSKLAELLHESIEQDAGFNWDLPPVHLPHAVEIEFVEQPTFGMFPRRFDLIRYQPNDRNSAESVPIASIRFSTPKVSAVPASEIVKLEQDGEESVETTLQYVNQIISFNYARRTARNSNTESR